MKKLDLKKTYIKRDEQAEVLKLLKQKKFNKNKLKLFRNEKYKFRNKK